MTSSRARDVTGCQDNRRRLMAFYGVSVAGMLLLMLPVIVTSAGVAVTSVDVISRRDRYSTR